MAASQMRTIQKKKEIAPAIELHQLAPDALQLQQRVSGDAMVVIGGSLFPMDFLVLRGQ